MDVATRSVSYRERLTPAWWLWLLALGMAASVGLAYGAPFTPMVGWVSGAVSAALFAALLLAFTPTIEVGGHELRAGRAHIDVDLVLPPQVLDREQAALLRGRDADSRAWMLLRGWVPTAVRIDLDDPLDPTPYWYVSTRRPDDLATAIERERTTHG